MYFEKKPILTFYHQIFNARVLVVVWGSVTGSSMTQIINSRVEVRFRVSFWVMRRVVMWLGLHPGHISLLLGSGWHSWFGKGAWLRRRRPNADLAKSQVNFLFFLPCLKHSLCYGQDEFVRIGVGPSSQ